MNKKRIAIVSSIFDDWGGSEELWGRSIPFLQENGHQIFVFKPSINREHPAFLQMAKSGVRLNAMSYTHCFFVRTLIRLYDKVIQRIGIGSSVVNSFVNNALVRNFKRAIKKTNPALVIVSQGINFDGLGYAYVCMELNIPYILVSQKAVDFYWPNAVDRDLMKKIVQQAKACYFVSNHNLKLTEEQFGIRLTNAQVVRNPVKVKERLPYPSVVAGFRLACVGRLMILDKGQDILLRILSKPKWRKRALRISFIGTGEDLQGLRELADLLGVEQVDFVGQIRDIESIWKDCHALILPSRSEGLPLAMVEAMALGRPVIVSRAGGNTELLDENVTGFSGEANVTDFEEAMERAWQQRSCWEEIGVNASLSIRKKVLEHPEKEFATRIHYIISAQ